MPQPTEEFLVPAAFTFFSFCFFWQMPHFWALALRYKTDYAKGGFPTLPVKHGQGVTLKQIIVWCLAYIGLALMAPLFLRVGWIYLVPTILISLKLIVELFKFVKKPESNHWLHFFLWVNLSLIIYLGAAAIDLWSIYLPIPSYTR